MKTKLSNFVAIDLGSNKLAGIAAYIDKKGEIRVLSQNLHYSEGLKSGIIVDLKAAENSVLSAIYALEKECDKTINQAAISLSGVGTKSYYISYKIKLAPNQQISRQDVKKLIQKTILEFKVKDQEIIHYFPIEFVIGANNVVDDPVGMYGSELGCQLHIVTADSGLLMNLISCLASCQIEVSDVMLGIYASGLACLSEDDKKVGTLIIDIGARTTSFGIFLFGKLIYSGHVPLGSAYVTSDIAKIFSVSLLAAEKLKVLYGSVTPSFSDKNASINMDDIDPDNQYIGGEVVITSSTLSEVIYPRMEEILYMIKDQYTKVITDDMAASRLVLTGGGSALRGIKELANIVFGKQVRISKPSIIPGFIEGYNPGVYSTAIGMILNQADKQYNSRNNIDLLKEDDNWLRKTITWLKENI